MFFFLYQSRNEKQQTRKFRFNRDRSVTIRYSPLTLRTRSKALSLKFRVIADRFVESTYNKQRESCSWGELQAHSQC